MGTYLVKANADGANVTFDSDFKGVTKEGQLKVSVYDRNAVPCHHR